MAIKHTINEMAEIFPQNENLRTEKYISVHNTSMKTYKGNSCGIKYGLSELSNDKTYLETELPARKRFKPETELFNTTKCLNKICKVIGNDDESTYFVKEEKYSGEISDIVSGEQRFENNPPQKELSKSDLNADANQQNESPVMTFSTCNSVFQNNIVANEFKLDSNELSEYNFEKKSENLDFETNSENDFYKNLDNDEISNRGTESEIEFDDEVNKCCELLNLDVPKIAVASTTDTKTTSDNFGKKIFENSEINKCKIGYPNYKNLDTLYTQSNKFVASLKSMSNEDDVNLGTINLGKKLEMQDELLNKKEKSCEDSIKFKDEGNLVLPTMVISNSFSTTYDKNNINMNNKFFHDEINVTVQGNNSFELDDDKYNSNLKIKDILNVNNSSVRESNLFLPMIQNRNSKSNAEHLNLTTKDTLSSDALKFQETNQIISRDHLNVNKEEILYNESYINFDETKKEIREINASESAHAILEETSCQNETVSHVNLENDSKNNIYTGNEVEKKDNFIFNEKIYPVEENYPLDNNKNCESPALDEITNNNFTENKTDFDIKVNESFVSEYEISLLVEDTDSILSEESFDSEYEISLLEDDINDEKNQNDAHENKSDSNVGSRLLNGDEKDEKIGAISQGHSKEFKMEEETEQIIDKIDKETDEVIFKNKIYSNNISESNIASCIAEERIPSNYQIATKTDFDVKISVQKEETQIFSKIKSSENTNDKTEQNFIALTDGMILKSEQPRTLKSKNSNVFDDILIKKELPEITNKSHFQLKFETNNESQTSNKVILNNNEFNNSEEKTAIVTANKNLADNACTKKPITKKFVKIELDVSNTGESKQNINEEFQPSNKVVFKRKEDEIRKNKEKEYVANIKKQLTESTCIDKVISEKTVKTDLKNSTSGESKQDVINIISDYYEEEKEDLINPGWNKIKELSTDEERYRQVRDCWKSKNIPNPFKNLTYYSYRKRKITYGETNTRQTKQHKRHASSNLNDKNAKRSRSCTYIFDDRIKSIEKEKEMKAKTLQDKMFNEVSRLNELQFQEEMGLQNFYGYNFEPRRQFQLNNLRRDYEQRVSSVTAEYEQKVNDYCDQYTTEIVSLKNSRNEVFQFYSFYKGLNTNEYKDPTVLTNAQIQELEEIENIYNQMDLHYK